MAAANANTCTTFSKCSQGVQEKRTCTNTAGGIYVWPCGGASRSAATVQAAGPPSCETCSCSCCTTKTNVTACRRAGDSAQQILRHSPMTPRQDDLALVAEAAVVCQPCRDELCGRPVAAAAAGGCCRGSSELCLRAATASTCARNSLIRGR